MHRTQELVFLLFGFLIFVVFTLNIYKLLVMLALALRFSVIGGAKAECGGSRHRCCCGRFPAFLPKEVHEIKDPFARTLAQRIQRLPVQVPLSPYIYLSIYVYVLCMCVLRLFLGNVEVVRLLNV